MKEALIESKLVKINITKKEADELEFTIADVLCFIKGVHFAATITGNKKLKEPIDFINIENLRKLRTLLRG